MYLEYADKKCLDQVLMLFRNRNIRILNLEITRAECAEKYAAAIFTLRFPKKTSICSVTTELLTIEGLQTVEEL